MVDCRYLFVVGEYIIDRRRNSEELAQNRPVKVYFERDSLEDRLADHLPEEAEA